MSAGGFFCARQDDKEEEEEEELLLDSPNISRELAEKVRQFNSENELVEYLAKEKPSDLRFGRELEYLDTKQLDDYMSGLCLKLDIHGYEDRAKRLKYLYEILRGKFSKKENVFKIVVQFLMDMAQRPTGVTHLTLSSILYSPDPEEDEDSSASASLKNSEKQRALLQEILGDDHPSNTETHYLSDADASLSEWSDEDDDDPCISSKSNNSLPPNIRPIRTSSSFGEFTDICPPDPPDPLQKEKDALKFWNEERTKAVDYLNLNIRRFETVSLTNQPVISSRLVLQARFGEWWEWKQLQKRSPPPTPLQIAFVEDCVRELLWQFTNCRSSSSPLFNEDWTVKSNLMVASLTKSTFDGIINKYGQLFKKLEILRNFQRDIMSASLSERGTASSPEPVRDPLLPPSKVYLNYSLGLHTIFIHITSKVAEIEKDLLRLPRPLKEEGSPPGGCTTFLQFEQQTRSLHQIIELIFKIHSKCILSSEGGGEDDNDKPWLSSLQLISTLEHHLILETRPRDHGCLLFLYVKCLEALFLEILSSLRTLQWDERYSLFVRNTSVRLNDLNFWSDCIKIREEFGGEGEVVVFGGKFTPLTSLGKLLPKVLNILKTCEVFDQLEEDFTQILGDSGDIKVEGMMEEFLEETLEGIIIVKEEEIVGNGEGEGGTVDFFKHFHALGLGSSMAANCFRFLKDPKFLEVTTTPKRKSSGENKVVKKKVKGEYGFEDFLNLGRIPSKPHSMVLDKVLCKWFDPFCKSAKLKIEKIFKEFKVLECMSVFQEIILTVREDFAKGIIELASKDFKASQVYKYEDAFNRNSKFQKLLNHCYPECREIFSIDLKLDPSSALNCTFEVTPKFPLNLIVTPQSVAGYIFIGRQLHRIRKSLWNVSSLSLKECCDCVVSRASSNPNIPPGGVVGGEGEGDVQKRMLILRFCLINFCFSLRSFFMLKIFSKDFSEYASSALWEGAGGGQGEVDGGGEGELMEEHHYFDLDSMRKVHENYLEVIKTEMLRHPMIENVLIRNLATMSESLRKQWRGGMKPGTLLVLEDTLKKCWRVVNDFEMTKYSPDFNQLSYHFGRPPSYLTN